MSDFSSQTLRWRLVGLPLIVGAVGLSSALWAQSAQSPSDANGDSLRPLAPGVYEEEEGAVREGQVISVAMPSDREGLSGESVVAETIAEEVVQEEVIKRWQVTPIAGVAVTYDDNIYITPDHKEGDFLFSIGAGFSYEYGDYRAKEESYFGARYVATGIIFADHSSNNALNHDAGIVAQYTANKLTLRLASNYLYLSGSDRDVGDWTERQLINTTVTALYDHSDKTTMDMEFQQLTSLYETYNDSYEYILKAGADYWITPKVALGLEGRVGFLDAQSNVSQTYEQLRLRGSYQVTGKILAKASAGAEVRHYDGGRGETVTPVFSLGAEWKARENTLVTLAGYRNIVSAASYYDQNQVITGVTLGVSQKLFQWATVRIDTGYENATYEATRSSVDADRKDNYFFVRPSVSAPVHRWVDAGVFYEYRRNNSSKYSDRFTNNRVGLELVARF